MSTYDEVQLIKCSAGAGSSGQSFKVNVTGAVSGAKFTDYKFTSWDWNTGLPSPPDSGVKYDSGHVFTVSGSMTCGSRAGNVIRTGTNLGIVGASYSIQAEGDDVNVTADAVSTTAMSASVTVTGQVNPGLFPLTGSSVSGIADYWYGTPTSTDQSSPPANNDPVEAHFHAAPVATAPDGGFLDMTWDMVISNPNLGTGLFNPSPTPMSMTARVNNRGLSASDFSWEWHAASDYSDAALSSTADYIWDGQVTAGDDLTLYLRYKFQGAAWINHGAVTFNDTRSGV